MELSGEYISENMIRQNKDEEKRGYVLSTLLILFSIYSIRFSSMPVPITPRIIVIMITIFGYNFRKLFNYRRLAIKKIDFFWVATNLSIFIYAWIIVFLNDTFGYSHVIVDNIFNFLVFVVLFPMFAEKIFCDAKHFAHCVMYAAVIQSIIVLLSFAFPAVRDYLVMIQIMDTSRYGWRVIGLGIAGAGGSVYLLTGLVASGYLIVEGDRRARVLICSILNIVAIALVGRTGFYGALMIIAYLVLFNSRKIGSKIITNFKLFSVGAIVFLVGYFAMSFSGQIDSELFAYTFNRLWELFRYGTDSYALSNINNIDSPVPGLSLQTLFGTGITRGTISSGGVFMHDGGYVQRYAAIGLIASILSYLVFVVYIVRWLKISAVKILTRRYLLFCMIVLLIIEYKEPFIYMLAYPFVLVMLSRLKHIRTEVK